MKYIQKKDFNNKKIVPILVRSAILSLCIYLGAYTTSDSILNDTRYSIVQEIEDENTMKEYLNTYNVPVSSDKALPLLYATSINDKLAPSEKKLLYSLEPIMNEIPYIDVVTTYNHLLDLRIEYIDRPQNVDKTTLATYSYKDNLISVFQSKEKANKDIMLHELVHTLFTNDKTIKLPSYFLEGCTELITNEYLSNSSFVEKNTYPYEVTMVKLLCEMVGSENVLKSYATGDMNYITDSLSKNMDKEESETFLENVHNVFDFFTKHETIPSKNYNDMILYMNKYFDMNYHDDSEKIDTYEYYKGIINLIYEKKPYKKYNDYIDDKGFIRKVYFSDKLSKEYPASEQVYLPKVKMKKLIV